MIAPLPIAQPATAYGTWTRRRRSLQLLALAAGPGILVMLGENDGPSMLSYAATGASYGIGFFVPFILLTFAMAYVVQEMVARIGIATGRGHAELIRERFGRWWSLFSASNLVVGNALTLVTEFIAIRAGAAYFGVPATLAVGGALLLVVVANIPAPLCDLGTHRARPRPRKPAVHSGGVARPSGRVERLHEQRCRGARCPAA